MAVFRLHERIQFVVLSFNCAACLSAAVGWKVRGWNTKSSVPSQEATTLCQVTQQSTVVEPNLNMEACRQQAYFTRAARSHTTGGW